MRSTNRLQTVAGLVLAVWLALATGCSSDDSSSGSTTTRAQGSGTDQSIDPEYETWCTSVQNLIEQSSPGDLSDIGTLASYNDAVQSLTTTAPDPVLSDMQTLATASQAKLEAVQVDPTATLPPEIAQPAEAAQDDVVVWVAENCGGLQLPEIDL